MKENLIVDKVTKYYKKFKAVDEASLTVNQGEFFTILGPSGSGKTSLLKLIAGFEEVSSGAIMLQNEDIAKKKPYERNIGMLFQNYALFPHMTVGENIAYPLRRRKIKKKAAMEKVKEVLNIVHLNEYINHYPNQLSGGQQQRVALARAIVFSPPLLLLDEPLSALDKNLRQRMQIEVKNIQMNLGITTISVTHDQEEALTMSDRICIMNRGGIEQIDTPENIYKYPKNKFVAEFIGEINLLQGTIIERNNESVVISLLNGKKVTINCPLEPLDTDNVLVALRPENLQIQNGEKSFINQLEASVTSIVYVGEALVLEVETDEGEKLKVKVPSLYAREIVIGNTYAFGWDPVDATYIANEEAVTDYKETVTLEA